MELVKTPQLPQKQTSQTTGTAGSKSALPRSGGDDTYSTPFEFVASYRYLPPGD
ncbi:hypothetical protein P2318_07270 [Myxococcaceae bacterium GXIMD 01537]